MRTNYKLLQYSWETDPKVKAWKVDFDSCLIQIPTRVKVNGEWVWNEPPRQYPKDVRTVEQLNNDWFLRTCEVWDNLDESKHLKNIQKIKNKIRKQLIRLNQISTGKRKPTRLFESELTTLEWLEYMEMGLEPEYKIHYGEYVDYVNVRFGLKIRKNVLTDEEIEKSEFLQEIKRFKAFCEAVS